MCLFFINISWVGNKEVEEIFELNINIDVRASGYKWTRYIYIDSYTYIYIGCKSSSILIEVWEFIKIPDKQQREQET